MLELDDRFLVKIKNNGREKPPDDHFSGKINNNGPEDARDEPWSLRKEKQISSEEHFDRIRDKVFF